jgi:hypothetical protein
MQRVPAGIPFCFARGPAESRPLWVGSHNSKAIASNSASWPCSSISGMMRSPEESVANLSCRSASLGTATSAAPSSRSLRLHLKVTRTSFKRPAANCCSQSSDPRQVAPIRGLLPMSKLKVRRTHERAAGSHNP